MRNLSSLLLEIENYLQSSLVNEDHINTSITSDLFNGEAGELIKSIYLNRSDDKEEYFKELSDTIWNVTQFMEEMGYSDIIDRTLW